MSQIPLTMPAVAYRRPLPLDDPESLIDVELPIPVPGPRDLLVQIEAIAVNPVDYKVRLNVDPAGQPKVLGWDASGTVVAVGEQVDEVEDKGTDALRSDRGAKMSLELVGVG